MQHIAHVPEIVAVLPPEQVPSTAMNSLLRTSVEQEEIVLLKTLIKMVKSEGVKRQKRSHIQDRYISLTQRSKELRTTQSWGRKSSQRLTSIAHKLEVADKK